MRAAAATELVALPGGGRVLRSARRVYVGDVGPGGVLRLDALLRLLQDVAGDDLAEMGGVGAGWVVRRTLVEAVRLGRFREDLELTTWCSGVGSRWAERRTSVTGSRGARIEAATLWVHVDVDSGRPRSLPPAFLDVVSDEARQREVTARLRHELAVPEGALPVPWTPRCADLDVLGHVNNAVAGAMVEQLSVDGLPFVGDGTRVELEYRAPIDPGAPVDLWAAHDAARARLWAVAAGAAVPGGPAAPDAVHVTAVVSAGGAG